MTAEIAILNRRAVTLAADSALTAGSAEKIYNTADKIFELSTTTPIALMIYNNLDYMGYPLDTIIRQFRASRYCRNFATVFDASEAFLTYLDYDFKISTTAEQDHIATLLDDMFSHLLTTFEDTLEEHNIDRLRAIQRGRRPPTVDPHAIFLDTVDEFTAAFEAETDSLCFWDVEAAFLAEYHKTGIDEVIEEHFPHWPLDENDRDLLRTFAGLNLKKNNFSSNYTGFVFAGFGEDQLFPSLQSFKFDGKIIRRQKLWEDARVSIDTEKVVAEIIPFGQKEMVDRFLFGVDPEYEAAMIENLREGVNAVGAELQKAMRGMRRARRVALMEMAQKAAESVMADLIGKTLPEIREQSKSETIDAVSVMAKADLANFAEALVEITSIKRRASLEKETVGGPIDVAVISKDDGFVWVKRKHYFNPDLNPRYFHRKYGIPSPRGGEAS